MLETQHTLWKMMTSDDCISIGDWSQAFLQALSFDDDLPPKFVSYRPYKGAKLRIFNPSKGAGGRPGHVFIAGFLFLRWSMPDAFCPVYNPDCAGAVCLKSPKLLLL